MVRTSSGSRSVTTAFRSSVVGQSGCLRPNASSCLTREAARRAPLTICRTSLALGSSLANERYRISAKPRMAVSWLLKSCATPTWFFPSEDSTRWSCPLRAGRLGENRRRNRRRRQPSLTHRRPPPRFSAAGLPSSGGRSQPDVSVRSRKSTGAFVAVEFVFARSVPLDNFLRYMPRQRTFASATTRGGSGRV